MYLRMEKDWNWKRQTVRANCSNKNRLTLGSSLKVRRFSFFCGLELLLSGKTFRLTKIRADTSHEVSALLTIFVFAIIAVR